LRDVEPGATDVVLRIDTSPRLQFAIDFAGRRSDRGPSVRIVREGDGEPHEREFPYERVTWLAAAPGTWRVFAHVRDLDANGERTDTWVEVGTATTGEPAKAFTVPK
jgi:hypothetical protein